MRAFLRTSIAAIFVFNSLMAFSQKLWTDASETQTVREAISKHAQSMPAHYRLLQLSSNDLTALQKTIPSENATSRMAPKTATIEFPLPDGKSFTTSIAETKLLDEAIQREHPEIKTYVLNDAATSRVRGRLTVTPFGVSGIIFTNNGTAYIHPFSQNLPDVYIAYFLKDVRSANKVFCGVADEHVDVPAEMQGNKVTTGDCLFRTYKLAVSATGEYTKWAGSQSAALSRITETINTVTAIYEREVAIRFTLVSNTNTIYTNASTDPFPTRSFPNGAILDSNHNALVKKLGIGNFDLGIVFNNGWNGGLAYRPSACNSSLKGGAAAGLSDTVFTDGPSGSIFVNTVAHEIGHQFSATHSFIASNGSCNGNVSVATSWEPGGGSTIMAYAGSCSDTTHGDNYYQFYSDDYFHAGNLAQIKNYVVTTGTCAVGVATTNHAPVVTVSGVSYEIPKSTPFMLSASGTDEDKDTIMFNWEQMDPGTAATTDPPKATNTNGPNFRSYPPSTDSMRIFPRMKDIVDGINPKYEVLPSVTRTLNFRVTGRDYSSKGGCTDEQNVAVTTNATAGPFVVTSQSTATTWTANGSATAAIKWNVANTTASPVNCSAVDILFSIDGGLTYPYTLLANTPNDGSQNVLIPNLVTFSGRVMVKAHNNIFFNINSADITIESACIAEGSTFIPGKNVSAPAGSPDLNLSLSPVYGSKFTPSGSITSTDPVTYLQVGNSSTNGCSYFSNAYYHDTYTFYVDNAGTYRFNKSTATPFGTIFNLYKDTFDVNSPCDNFLASNGEYNPDSNKVYLSGFVESSLSPKIKYVLTVGTFSASQPTRPFKDTIKLDNSSAGSIYNGIPSPGNGFNYAYVIYNKTTNIIKAISADADLSDGSKFTAATYVVYGLSYSNTITTAMLNGYVGGNFSALYNDLLQKPSTRCGNLSKNFIEVTVTGALPVNMLPLTATKIKRTSLLQWATVTEENSSYFEIERSPDGRNYKAIDRVSAKGNSSVKISYDYVDKNPLPGNNYYQLKEVDKDSRYSMSNIASLSFDDASLLTAYPNPAKSVINLKYITAKNETAEILIYDSKGVLVGKNVLSAQPGVNTKPVNMSAFAKGVYAIRLISNSGNFTLKITKE